MAQNEINIKVKISDDGSLSLVSQKAEQAAKSTEKLADSRNRYSKGEKGVAGATSNSTKAFSKMNQAMGGGLVPAYATLAANVFALSAAFGVLRRAAQVEQLSAGLQVLGEASGLAMDTLSRGLQESTGYALSMEEAMRSTAMITSAGLDPSLIEDFGKAAKNASIALGRNTQDSLERFTRGVTKLEPELLDELGIFVKLDEAYDQYAQQLGKGVNQLTSFEKRQAFANATLGEANAKFGALSQVDANPYDKLAAAFADVSKAFLTIVNSGIIPFLTLLLQNTGLLVGAVALFGSTISGKLIGSLGDYAAGAADTAAEQRNLSQANIESLTGANRSAKTLTNLTAKLADGTAEYKDFERAVDGQNQSQITNNRLQAKGTLTVEENNKRQLTAKKAITEVRKAQLANTLATANDNQAKAMASLQSGNYRLALTQLWASLSAYRQSARAATLQTTALSRAFALARVAGAMFAATARTIGAAVSVALGPIGIAISVVAMLAEGVMFLVNKFKSEETKALEMAFEDASRAGKELDANFRNISDAAAGNSKTINTATQRYMALGNATSTTLQQMDKLKVAAGSNAEVQREASKKQVEFLKARVAASAELRTALAAEGITNINTANLEKAKDVLVEIKTQGEQTASVREALKNLNEETTRYFNTLSNTTPMDGMADGLGNLMKAIDGTDDIEDITKIIDEGIGQAGRLRTLFEKAEGSTQKEKLTNLAASIQGEQTRLRTAKDVIEQKQLDVKITQSANNLSLEGVQAIIEAEEALREAKFKNVVKSLEYQELQLKAVEGTEDEAQVQAEINRLKSEMALLTNQEATAAENTLRLETQRHKNLQELQKSQKMILDFGQRQFDIAQKQDQLDLQKQRRDMDLYAAKQGRSKSAAEAAKEAEAQAKVLKDSEIERVDLRKQGIDLEYDLLASQFKLEEARIKTLLEAKQITQAQYDKLMGSAGAAGSGILGAQSTIEGSRAAAQAAAQAEEKAKTEDAATKAGIANLKAIRAVQEETFSFIQKEIDAMKEKGRVQEALAAQEALNASKLAQLRADLSSEKDPQSRLALEAKINELKRQNVGITQERLGIAGETAMRMGAPEGMTASITGVAQDMADPEGVMNQGTNSEKFAFLKKQTEGFMSDLSQLSPEGALMSSIAQGALQMGEAFSNVFTEIGDKGLTVQTAMQAVGATISAIGAMQQAKANQAVSAIDKEIAAEKKKDGKSKESIAKIKALEAKKEKIKRKAFEQDKKMKIAMAVISTASAAIAAAAPPNPPLPLSAPMVAMAIAMGAAQVAAISSTSYQGGGSVSSAGGTSTPTQIKVGGDRRSTTDLAKSQGAGGELAYFRGAQGIGGPENFRPAASGMKYRANGGNTAFMVGEQGPEMFIPERPGTIVPSDETPQLGTPINANINITALDADGVEDILMNQRGNIIGMLRDAANANGETFLESVSVQEY